MKSKVLISLLVFTALLFGMILNVSAKLYTPEVTVTQENPLTNKDVYDINDLSKPVTRVDSIPAVFRFTPDEPTQHVRDHYYD